MLGDRRKNSLFSDRATATAPEAKPDQAEVHNISFEESTGRAIFAESKVAPKASDLFFAPQAKGMPFAEVLSQVQSYLSGTYATLITEDSDEAKVQMKRRMARYLQDQRMAVEGMTQEELVDALYTEMAEYGFLTKYIFADGIEEIDINSWRDIEIQYSDGRTVKLDEHFDSPDHAANVIRRMLQNSGKVLDNASPIITSRLAKNIRVSVIKTPVLDEDAGVAASIRIVNPRNLTKEDFVASGTATDEMLDFLSACLRYGVSICVAGATSSGKTTVAGWLLSTIPDRKRIFTIEDGSRELQLIEAEVDGKFIPVGEDVLKTKSSFRTLPLIPAVEKLLLEEKEKQEMFRRLFKKSYCRDYLDYICVDQTGHLLRPNYVTEHFAWLIQKYDLKKIRFHDLRHTCASLLLSNGISMKQIQIWLGHSTFATTADIYAHLDFTAQEESANAMSGMFTRATAEQPA